MKNEAEGSGWVEEAAAQDGGWADGQCDRRPFYSTTSAPATTATKATAAVQMAWKPESRRKEASDAPAPDVLGALAGADPAMTVAGGRDVAPFGALPAP